MARFKSLAGVITAMAMLIFPFFAIDLAMPVREWLNNRRAAPGVPA